MGGSRDREELDMWPVHGSINLAKVIAGREFTELYERTTDAVHMDELSTGSSPLDPISRLTGRSCGRPGAHHGPTVITDRPPHS